MKRLLRSLLWYVALPTAGVWIGGMQLPANHVSSVTAEFNCSPYHLYNLLQPRQYPAWRDDLWDLEIIDDRNFVEIVRWGRNIPYTVTKEKPPWQIVVERSSAVAFYAGKWTYTLRPKAGRKRTTVTIEEEGQIALPPLRLLYRYGPGYDRTIQTVMDHLQLHIDYTGCR